MPRDEVERHVRVTDRLHVVHQERYARARGRRSAHVEIDSRIRFDALHGAVAADGRLVERLLRIVPEHEEVGLVPDLEAQRGFICGRERVHHVVDQLLPDIEVARRHVVGRTLRGQGRGITAGGPRLTQPRRHGVQDHQRFAPDPAHARHAVDQRVEQELIRVWTQAVQPRVDPHPCGLEGRQELDRPRVPAHAQQLRVYGPERLIQVDPHLSTR